MSQHVQACRDKIENRMYLGPALKNGQTYLALISNPNPNPKPCRLGIFPEGRFIEELVRAINNFVLAGPSRTLLACYARHRTSRHMMPHVLTRYGLSH